jgi:hypothetical protein
MVKINTFFAEWWLGPTSADWQGQNTVNSLDYINMGTFCNR